MGERVPPDDVQIDRVVGAVGQAEGVAEVPALADAVGRGGVDDFHGSSPPFRGSSDRGDRRSLCGQEGGSFYPVRWDELA